MPVIVVEQTLPVLDGRHRLDVRTLTLGPDRLDVEYTITPPLPEGPSEDMVLPRLEATDDHGRTYNDGGGAFGLSDDGARTLGTISGQPGFPSDVREVTLRFALASWRAENEYELTVPLR
jgi:hypothetical protein